MESESGDVPPGEAEAQLRSHEDMRAKVERRGPSRAYASLMLWSALVMSAYIGVFMFAFTGPALDDATAGAHNSAFIMLLMFPILVFSSLLGGARERFSIRRNPVSSFWVVPALILVAFGVLGVMAVMGVAYPWLLNLIVPVALFVVMAANPIRQLLGAAKTPGEERWVNEPLSRPAQRNTAAIGGAAGLLAATSTQQLLFPILMVVIILGFIVLSLAFSASWGLARTGYEWGPLHWSVFGVTLGVVFLLALLLARTTMVTTLLAVIAGVLAFAVMLGASLLPRPRTGNAT